MYICDQNERQSLFDLGQMILTWNFPHNAMSIYSTFWSHHYVGHTVVGHARKPYGRRRNHESASILFKNYIHYLFALAQMHVECCRHLRNIFLKPIIQKISVSNPMFLSEITMYCWLLIIYVHVVWIKSCTRTMVTILDLCKLQSFLKDFTLATKVNVFYRSMWLRNHRK